MNNRPIYIIAEEISADWKKVSYSAKPYLDAMFSLEKITDNYGFDSALEIVCRFICNSQSYRGQKAKELKNELRVMAGLKPSK